LGSGFLSSFIGGARRGRLMRQEVAGLLLGIYG
jgi:hypothetical protein